MTEQYLSSEFDDPSEWKELFVPDGGYLMTGADFTRSIVVGRRVATVQESTDDSQKTSQGKEN